MTTLRPVRPLALPPDAIRAKDFGDLPKRVFVNPTDLMVDDAYQRDLNRRSFKLIAKIVAGFKWSKLKTPTCISQGGKLHVIDGQHTAIAAATLGIKKMAVDLVTVASLEERSEAFVAHNRDRLAMTALDIYRAQLGGRQPDAVRIDRVCRDAGIRLKVISHMIEPKVGDCASIATIRDVIKRRGPGDAGKVLGVLIAAARAPLSTAEITAVDQLFGDGFSVAELTRAAKEIGPAGVLRCQAKATTERISIRMALVEAYERTIGRKIKKAA